MNETELQTVILAGLLHDIGKFYLWKSDIKEIFKQKRLRGHGHARWSADFIERHKEVLSDIPELIDIVLYHGQPSKNRDYNDNERDKNKILKACIIAIADKLSSKERREEEEKVGVEEQKEKVERSEFPLLSVFNEINLGLKSEGAKAYGLNPLTIDRKVIFPLLNYPDDKIQPHAPPTIGQQLDKEFSMIGKNADVITILHLLYKYIWSCPSATPSVGTVPDVSLYDHARTTAAIAACLYLNYNILTDNKAGILEDALTAHFNIKIGKRAGPLSVQYNEILNTPLFLLLTADMFGTQNYIYAHSNIPGTSRRLRGRSFYLYLLTEIITRYIIYHPQIRLSPVNILYCAGGNFQLLLPLTVMNAIDTIIRKINQRLFHIFKGKLGFVFTQEKISPIDFDNWDNVLKRLADKLSEEKKRKLSHLLTAAPSTVIIPSEDIPGRKDLCKSCGDTIPYSESEEEQICRMCKIHAELGQILPKTVGLLFYQGEGSIGSINDSFDCYELNIADIGKVALIVKKETSEKPKLKVNGSVSHIEYYQLNDTTDFINAVDIENGVASFGYKFIGNVVPLEKDGSVMDFEKIAHESEGAGNLGVLKMDVDNLGLILQIGLSAGEQSDRTISRLATLSRTIELFFAGYIHKICERFKNIYIIYSGGDDLMIVGPWSKIPHLAQSIYKEFREYTCQNENITLSGGIFLCDPKFPVKRFAPLAGDELRKSKRREGKNSCTIFDTTVVWQKASSDDSLPIISYDELMSFGEELYGYITNKMLARGFLHQLLRLHHLYFGQDQRNKWLYLPSLIWQIIRNIRDNEVKMKLYEKLITDKMGIKWMENIKIPASYALLKTRR